MPYYVYVTCMEDDLINVFAMDADSGVLTHLRDVAVSGRPAPLAISPDKTMLHVGRRGIPGISSFRIAQDSGDLSFAGTVPVDVDPCYVGIDRRGRFLFSAYYEGARAAVHPIGDDGAVTDPPVGSSAPPPARTAFRPTRPTASCSCPTYPGAAPTGFCNSGSTRTRDA